MQPALEASSNSSSSEARWTGNQPAASHSPYAWTCDLGFMERLKRDSTQDLHVKHNVADLLLQVAPRNSLLRKLPEQNNRMLHKSIFCTELKVLHWSGRVCRNQSHCPADWVIPSSCEDRECHVAGRGQALGSLKKTREQSHRLLSTLPPVAAAPWNPSHRYTYETHKRERTPMCILRKTRRGEIQLFASIVRTTGMNSFKNGSSLVKAPCCGACKYYMHDGYFIAL